MDRFLTFLGEAFPPPKKSPKPESKGSNSPFDSKDRASQEKPNPGFNQQKAGDKGFKQTANGDEPEIKTDRVEVGPGQDEQKTGEFDKQKSFENMPPGQQQQGPPQQNGFGGPPQADPLAMMQWQAQQEKEHELEMMRAQKQAEADAEAAAVKELRAKAEAEVAAALEDKYNSGDDAVEFYPELLTFGQFTRDGKQDPGGPGQQPGAVGDRYPEDAGKDGKKVATDEDDEESDEDEDDSKLKDTAAKQDARQDEEDETDPNPDEEDDEDVESQRAKRQKDAEQGDVAKKSNKQQKKW